MNMMNLADIPNVAHFSIEEQAVYDIHDILRADCKAAAKCPKRSVAMHPSINAVSAGCEVGTLHDIIRVCRSSLACSQNTSHTSVRSVGKSFGRIHVAKRTESGQILTLALKGFAQNLTVYSDGHENAQKVIALAWTGRSMRYGNAV